MNYRDKQNIVYSSQRCSKPIKNCICQKNKKQTDGIVRVRRETKKRGGKTVTVIMGLPLEKEQMKDLASQLKRRFGVGGAIKGDNIEIQGDHADTIIEELNKQGYKTKRSGG